MPTDRVLYHYWDGSKTVQADPMWLYKRILAVGPELSKTITESEKDLNAEESRKASDQVLVLLRGIFNVQNMDGGGLTETETMDLLHHFWDFMETLRRKNRPQPPLGPSPVPNPTNTPPSESGSV